MLRTSLQAMLVIAVGLFSAGCQAPTEDVAPVSTETATPVADQTPAVEPENEEPPVENAGPQNPVVVIETSKGTIVAELWPDESPKTVENFLAYVDDGFFDGTIFHRVIPGFMIQGGGFTPDMQQEPTKPPVDNEARADVRNDRGTLAMARTGDPHSATAQFFINHADNDFLNHTEKNAQGFGYCVFGKVIEGLDVVDAIAAVKTTTKGSSQDVPAETVEIISIRRR